MKNVILLIFTLLFTQFIFAQTFTLSGSVKSAEDQSTFPGATVLLTNPADTSTLKGNVTDFNGEFRIGGIETGKYLIRVNFVGFETLYQPIEITESIKIEPLLIQENTQELDAVIIEGKAMATMMKGDTSEFSAKAYKTAPDASSQDLIEKLPGISNVDGKLQANGEDVQLILVDGKPFFGGDVNAALQNLPAEVVASIQIFDKKSDKAALSGFDDGNQQKTINIITKPSRRIGQFGKSTAGVGTNSTYQAGASVNFFNNDRRITVTGLSNNINTINYSADPNSLGDSRTQNGLIRTNNIGINFSDDIGEHFEVHGSYDFSNQQKEENRNKLRDYALASDSGQVYKEDSYTNNLNNEHKFRFKLEYKPDENNTFLMRPNFSFRHEDDIREFEGSTSSGKSPINNTLNNSTAFNSDYDYNNDMFYSRKFDKKGRSLTTRLHTGYHTNRDESNRMATNIFYNEEDSLSTIDQQTTRDRTGVSWEWQASYTEPLGERSLIELEYEIGDRLNDSDKLTYSTSESDNYTTLDTALSNTFENSYLRQQMEIGYQYSFEKLKVQLETEYQLAHMQNDQVFPQPYDQNRWFTSILPSARVDYRFDESRRLEVNYRTWTQEPSIGDLQDVIDNSNPLQLQAGNPNLNQTYNHWTRARMWSNNMESGKSLYASMETAFASDLITKSTIIADKPMEVSEGVTLENGSQLTRPVNVDGYYHFRTYLSYGEPVDIIKSNVRLSGGMSFTKRPGQINDLINFSNSSNYHVGLSLSSNISEYLDFNISTRSNYNVVENTLRPNLNNNFFNQTTRVKYRWVFLDGIVYRMDLRHRMNSGLSAGYDNNFLLMNMSAGKKFLKDNLAEISINVYDLFEQNNNVQRNITELYVEDNQSTVLQRYFMLTFTYNIRHFNAGTTIEDFDDI
ncbi:MAG: TonB-dependent receptor [Marinoscillum sp.]